MSAKSAKTTEQKKPPDKTNTPTTSLSRSSASKTNPVKTLRKNGIMPPLMCTKCEQETENNDDIFKCDGCFATYHIQCDGVRKGDVTARASSVNLRLFCSTCNRKDLSILNCEKLSVIYDYVVKIDCHTQSQVEKQVETVDKLANVVSQTNTLNKKIDDIKAIKNNIDDMKMHDCVNEKKKRSQLWCALPLNPLL